VPVTIVPAETERDQQPNCQRSFLPASLRTNQEAM